MYQLRRGLFRARVLFAPGGQSSAVPVVFHAAGVMLEPVKVTKVIRSEKGKDLLVIEGFQVPFPKNSS
jgi:hypothetical protein